MPKVTRQINYQHNIHAFKFILLGLIFFTSIASIKGVGGHIIGPGIAEPSQSGWTFKDEDADVMQSKINDIDRASRAKAQIGLGVVFAGTKVFINGTVAAWYGVVYINGTIAWERVESGISAGFFTEAVACQYNTSEEVYIAGQGPAGWTVLSIDVEGNEAWRMNFDMPGCHVVDLAIIKNDAGYTMNDNGITLAIMNGTGPESAMIVNLHSSNGTQAFQHVVDPTGATAPEIHAVATDPLLPSAIYMGGQLYNNTLGKYEAFVTQFNITTMEPAWHRILEVPGTASVNAIQVEPIAGSVICVGSSDDDAFVYPLLWYGIDGWNLRDEPYVMWGGSGQEIATDVVIIGEQTFMMYVSGWTTSYGLGGKDFFVFKMDFYSNMIWEKTWGAARTGDLATGMTAEPGLGVMVSGQSGEKGIIVENPATGINPFVKWLGSRDLMIMMLVLTILGVVGIACVIVIQKTRKKRKILEEWIEGKKNESKQNDEMAINDKVSYIREQDDE